jgi:hypothetical protein
MLTDVDGAGPSVIRADVIGASEVALALPIAVTVTFAGGAGPTLVCPTEIRVARIEITGGRSAVEYAAGDQTGYAGNAAKGGEGEVRTDAGDAQAIRRGQPEGDGVERGARS